MGPGSQDLAEEGRLSRRRFIRYLTGFSVLSTLAIVVTPVIGFLVPSKSSTAAAGGRVLVSTLDKLPAGQGAVVAVGSKPAIVINTAQGVTAYSAICTHLGCIVTWDSGANLIVCPCHDGRFNPANGAVVSGPPPAPLPALTTAVEGTDIYVITG
jgi:cytochrome b6-f complex iron-sulfur subunit